ncbi:hypothetical protein QMK33_19840 [Hymenobacter sp. H14-R3]|uniref:hypothetical protein n=1 Tax=Hymenobacter sp. H14-R3 TaxID=3046308 RepID=UPI0024BBC576|nr:hypothetical protein [Hymenobacter sp. H14-R3]MDJ0367407.1 hypothetical protein [Hymenobacter sp. H14-R3]
MTFFELHDQFFQLNNQQPIPALASKLYMYWLNEFNRARWPAVLYRRANQVYADLPCDKNTFGRAVAQLAERGLLHFDSNSRGWELNYGPAADWLPTIVNNSPQPAQVMVNNSPQDVTELPKTLHLMVNNSPPIRNRPDIVLEKDQPKKKAGEAAEEITLAPLSAKKEVSAPRCEAPPKSEAAQLPEALATEAKQLAVTMGQLWKISEQKNFQKFALICAFTKRLAQLDRLAEVQEQFAGYRLTREKSGIRAHRLTDWLGAYADDYAGGEWCGCDWAAVAAETRQRPGEALTTQTPARAGTSPAKLKAQSWA